MSFMLVHSPCAACEQFIGYNPHRVPSIRVNGTREPLCRACFDRWNIINRTSQGLEPEPLHPEAYEPVEGA